MRIGGAVFGLMLAVVVVTAIGGSALACEDEGQKIAPATDRLEGKIAALLTAEVAGPSSDATSLGLTLLVHSEGRLVTVVVLDGAQIVSPDGETLTADAIPFAATVLLTGRWTGDETFEATKVELL